MAYIIKEEYEVLKSLTNAWNDFLKLKTQHPNEQKDFSEGIHRCQGIIMARVARAAEPEIFPKK